MSVVAVSGCVSTERRLNILSYSANCSTDSINAGALRYKHNVESFAPEAHKLSDKKDTLTIQVVDDDEITQNLVRMLLARKYNVTVSPNAVKAVEDYIRVRPDLVFLDINLGEHSQDGFAVLRALHKIDWDVNAVMISGSDTTDNMLEAARQGALGFIAKPFSRKDLLNSIEMVM